MDEPASLHSLPSEVKETIVFEIISAGTHSERDAVALASVNWKFRNQAIDYVYKYTVKLDTFHLAHWAAAHGRMGLLRTARRHGADIDRPITSGTAVHDRNYPGIEKLSLPYRTRTQLGLNDNELDSAVEQHAEDNYVQMSLGDGYWRRRRAYSPDFYDGSTYELIDLKIPDALVFHYLGTARPWAFNICQTWDNPR